MTTYDYFMAGYQGMESLRPHYGSSNNGMAFTCGEWCRKNHITAMEIKASRGYKWIVNRRYILDFKTSDTDPKVSLNC